MRLIDADTLIEELHHMIEGDADLRKDYEYMGIDDCIRSIPTAYNVDAVVAELECLRNAEADYYFAKSNDVIYRETAIDIVKSGGVE